MAHENENRCTTFKVPMSYVARVFCVEGDHKCHDSHYLLHSMGQIIKSLMSVCLSVTSPTVTILTQF